MQQEIISSYSSLCVELENLLKVIDITQDYDDRECLSATLNVVSSALKGIIDSHEKSIRVITGKTKEILNEW
ncbi:MAG: hypothetical protein WAV43_07385 [Streptococcus parauberis]